MNTRPHQHSTSSTIIDTARTVLAQEISGLQALSEALDDNFIQVIDLLFTLKGRVIVSGMGKSGHIARKIAATLASTGTPSFFVHPGEASHGDLGMITKEDALIVLSNSGETAELSDMINYAARFGIPLVAVVRRQTSVLVAAATVALVLPEIAEASSIGAPTTSTTMMLALGDAIAVALLERKGFSREEFGTYHPGGKLGQAFVKVEQLMHAGDVVPLVSEDTLMAEVLIEMTAKAFGCVGVITKERLLAGIITDGDLRRHMGADLTEQSAKKIMTANPITIKASNLASHALKLMEDRKITSLFVMEEDKHSPIGILHIHDLLRAKVI